MGITDVYERLEIRLASRPPRIVNETGDFSAAVIVPLVIAEGEPAILFEVRSSQLVWQPGEICFPGGRIEAGDASPERAAIRETYEELGLGDGGLKLLGPLDQLVSSIGVVIYPFAGYITKPDEIKPNSDEVAEVFVVPLKFLANNEPLSAAMEVATKPLPGFPFELVADKYPRDWNRRSTYSVLFYKYKDYVIWGLTAKVLYSFIQIYRETGLK